MNKIQFLLFNFTKRHNIPYVDAVNIVISSASLKNPTLIENKYNVFAFFNRSHRRFDSTLTLKKSVYQMSSNWDNLNGDLEIIPFIRIYNNEFYKFLKNDIDSF